jgi:phage repressor protein C with HTH and peptisase S24 domain
MINNLKKIRERKKLSVINLAEKSGISRDLIYKMEKGEIGISKRNILLLEKALNVSASEIYGGDSQMIPIKFFDITASFGSSCFVNNENFEIINIDEKQLIKMDINSNYDNISIIHAKGNSMIPTIQDGDLLFIDISKKEIFNKKIYVINEDKFLKVKRIIKDKPDAEKVIVKSDNEIIGEYPPYEIAVNGSENIICGEVIFFCRRIEKLY